MSRLIFVPVTAAADTGADVARQTTLALARIDEQLRAERSGLADAVVMTVYLRQASDFAAMNDAYRQAWQGAAPTRTTVITDLLPRDANVQISAVAVPSGVERRIVHPSAWMASPNPYSYAIRTGDLLFLSGLVARNGRDNTPVSGSVAVQTKAVMDNARELLEAAGLSFPHVVSARAFLPNLDDFAEFNRVYREYVGADRPARATVGASLTTPAYNVEVTLVASAGPREAIETVTPPNPNLSAAIKSGASLFISGLLAGAEAMKGDAVVQSRDIVVRMSEILRKGGFAPADVRDLLVYVTDEEAATSALSVCRDAFSSRVPASAVRVRLAAAGARVEIMAYAERE